ncbi:MAG: site-2 protease family protein [Actinomycetota bacterium]|nr:site-2 protease family protein [Actinomycetota bacterium]
MSIGAPRNRPNPPGPVVGLLKALSRPLLVVAVFVAVAIAFRAVGVLVVVLAIAAMIMLHELGHFVTAKLSGMKVTEYFFGFGPRLWSVTRGETSYGVKAIPAGGYVKIVGMTMLEDVPAEDESRSYRQASFPRRVLVASAGSLVHFLLAFVLLWSVFAFLGTQVASAPTVSGLFDIGNHAAPAQLAGIKPGDVFVSVNGRPTPTFASLSSVISKSAGRPLEVVVRRRGRLVRLVVTPAPTTVTSCVSGVVQHHTKGEIGVELSVTREVAYGPFAALPRSAGDFASLFHATFAGLGSFFSLSGLRAFGHQVVSAGSASSSPVTPCAGVGAIGGTSGSGGGTSSGQIVSILGAVQLGSQLYSLGLSSLFIFLAFINLFVGVVNLVPMLPLDGGHVAIAVYERIRSRRGRPYHADVAKLMPFAYIFLAFVLILGIGALYSNILQPVHLTGG